MSLLIIKVLSSIKKYHQIKMNKKKFVLKRAIIHYTVHTEKKTPRCKGSYGHKKIFYPENLLVFLSDIRVIKYFYESRNIFMLWGF